ncbi:xenotropic and polytropic retrovirus receptor 1 homolog [Austrofundulus limnaeus]|uniref:Xenotropic and polytropic retrovirus receptor 1 homolog n=1 Tax=Austrofundulus limnaeus TaxID=52670 RepID=A0A2I4C214_AUSLI|nr:PREDICTED: xenotropic and polytropic retrovirus receptor 1 homolog [Austrofundulus limnaeus]
MKFTEHLSAHITPEWRKQYIQYEAFKEMLYAAQDQAPSVEVTDEDTVKRYYAKFEEKFFQTCEKELAKINTFYSEKLAEAQRRFATLQNELQSSLDAQRESSASGRGLRRRKTVFALSQKERCKHRNIQDLQLAFSEFYLSLILLQNYQNLNFTGFRKILKKHDKILETSRGADWRVGRVEVAPFYTCKKITQLISETEALVTTELEGGDRQKAMKRLRVPPLGAAQPAPAWTTFRVGLYCGVFLVLVVTVVIAGAVTTRSSEVWPMVRIYRGGFLIIEFLFLLGINTYGWRQAGVNHVLIFELNPRNNLSHQHLFEIAGLLGVLWCVSLLSCLFHDHIQVPMQANPLALYGFFLLFLINPFKTCYYKSRFWLLKLLFRVVTAPFHHVGFADFWLADQLNSLVVVLMDLEYMICFYSSELIWTERDGLIRDTSNSMCHTYSYGIRAVIKCLPAWFRFAQCLRRYRDTKRAFPHLVNAGKYSTSFFVVTFSALYSTHRDTHPESQIYFYLYIACLVISSCYTLIWDLKMDWGLFDRNAGENTFLREEIVYPHKAYYYCAIVEDVLLRFAWILTITLTFSALYSTHRDTHPESQIYFYLYIACLVISSCYTLIWDLKMDWGLFDRNAGENTFLREEIVYPHKAYYYCAIVEDVLLRFAWILTITLTTLTGFKDVADILATVLAPLEVFRRFVWNFFRLENEHLNNCGEFRAVRDISVAPLNADDQTLLEQMMDQEDGVRNRQGKKTWKRSYSMSLRRPRLASQSKTRDTKVLIDDTDDDS